MSSILSGKLTVYFETQFWVGVFERVELKKKIDFEKKQAKKKQKKKGH
ncbi:hypothetical protein [Tepidibacter sp. Z1-5]